MNIQEKAKHFKDEFSKRTEIEAEKLSVSVYEDSSGVLFTLEEFLNQYNPEDIQKGQANIVFSVNHNKKPIARFRLQDMVNCSGIIINSDVFVSKFYLGKGLGTLINSLCIDFCKYYGYGIMQATDKDMNEYQKKIFVKNNWKQVASFINPKTLNRINVWMYFLN